MKGKLAPAGTEFITCMQCDGRGAGKGIDGRCPACGGTGLIVVPLEPREEVGGGGDE
jgi:DnaJ-class molecular chaperone